MPRQHENDPHMNDITVHRQLASLQTSVEHLAEALKNMATQSFNQEAAASAGRKALHDKLESFKDQVGVQISGLSLRVDRLVDSMKSMDDAMSKVDPVVRQYEDEKMREEGAKKFGAKIVAGLVAISGAVGWGVHELIGFFKH
jgi:hypothetical protein